MLHDSTFVSSSRLSIQFTSRGAQSILFPSKVPYCQRRSIRITLVEVVYFTEPATVTWIMRGTPNPAARAAARAQNHTIAMTNLPKGKGRMPKPKQAADRVVDLTEEPAQSAPQNFKPLATTPGRSPESVRKHDSVVKPIMGSASHPTGSGAGSSKLEGVSFPIQARCKRILANFLITKAKRNVPTDSQLPFKRHRLTSSVTPTLASERFPVFSKGTVEIVVSPTNAKYNYRLHRAVLERNSEWFRTSLSEADELHPDNADKIKFKSSGSGACYTFVLVADTLGQTHIVRKSPAGDSFDATCQASGLARSVLSAAPRTGVESSRQEVKVEAEQQVEAALADSSGPDIQTLEGYNSLFLTFYNVSPAINSNNISQALSQCEKILSIARDVGSVSVVQPHLNSALSQYPHRLFEAIAVDPPRWAKLAVALQSGLIFTESIIHLVGCWPSWPWSTSKETLDNELKDLLIRKAKILAEIRTDANHDLFLNTISIGEGGNERAVDMKSSF